MTDDLHRFRVIDGTAKPKPYRARKRGESEPLICTCGSARSREVRLGRMIRDGKPEGGTKAIVCDDCGERLI